MFFSFLFDSLEAVSPMSQTSAAQVTGPRLEFSLLIESLLHKNVSGTKQCFVTWSIYLLPPVSDIPLDGCCDQHQPICRSLLEGHSYKQPTLFVSVLCAFWLHCWERVGLMDIGAAVTFSRPAEQADLMKGARNLESWLCLFSADWAWTNNLTSLSLFHHV